MDWSSFLDTASFVILLPEFLGEEKVKELEHSLGALSGRIARSFLPSRRQVSSARHVMGVNRKFVISLIFSVFSACATLLASWRTILSPYWAGGLSVYMLLSVFLFFYSAEFIEVIFEIGKEEQSPVFLVVVGAIFSLMWPAWTVLFLVAVLVSASLSGIARAFQGERSAMRPIYISAGIVLFFLARILSMLQISH